MFKVNITVPFEEARYIDVWLTDIPASTNYDLTLYHPNESLLQTSNESANNDEHLRQWVDESGDYYIQIESSDSSFSRSGSYSLMLEVSQAPVREVKP